MDEIRTCLHLLDIIIHNLQCEAHISVLNLFKKGLGVDVPGNQHDNRYALGEIQRQIVRVCAIKYYVGIGNHCKK